MKNNNQQDRQSLLTEQTQVFLTEPLITNPPQTQSPNATNQLQSAAPEPKKQRFISLDVLRGLTVIGMLIVDNLYPRGPWWIDHPEWDGFTLADLIFPSFVFIMGMAVPLSLTEKKPFRLRNFLRIVGLFAIGLLLNLAEVKYNFSEFRVMGILQRISLCYGYLCLIHVLTRYGHKSLRFIGLMLTIGCAMVYLTFMLTFQNYQIGCKHEDNLSPRCNFGSYWDRRMFGQDHMYDINDPEGLFTTLTACVNAFAGYWFCLVMLDSRGETKKLVGNWIGVGLLSALIALPLVWLMPLNKKIWSISYTFLTIGISAVSLALITIMLDIFKKDNQRYQKFLSYFTAPFIWFGRNPLAIFVSRDLVDCIMNTYIVINGRESWYYVYHYLFETWIQDVQLGSLLFSVFMLLFFVLEAWLLYRGGIFIRL